LTENQDKLTALAEQLLTTEVIFKEDLERIFGKRQWESEELVEHTEVLNEATNETELPSDEASTDSTENSEDTSVKPEEAKEEASDKTPETE
jgi:cell division protease FtsH